MSTLLENLNLPQSETVKTLSGPMLVLAGAGSGKTRVLTRRLANLVDNGVKPWRIVAVTFTNKAAHEMKERVAELIGEGINSLWIGTFHSLAVRLLRTYGDKINVDRHFIIYDSDDQKQLIKRILKDMNKEHDAGSVRSTISILEAFRRGAVHKLFYPTDLVWKTYKDSLKEFKAIDFTGLLEEVLRLKPFIEGMWDHVLVDEFQDTSRIQFDFLRMLVPPTDNICVVGDDDQSIYSWRGANPEYLLRFEKEFKGAKIIRLEQNYRSSGNIIKAASQLVANNTVRRPKTLWTDQEPGEPLTIAVLPGARDEARWAVNHIKQRIASGATLSQFAVLYRLNAQSRSFEEELRRAAIPYRLIGGLRFYERAEIKDLLSYLRLTLNRESENDILRVLNKPRRGIGAKSVEVMRNHGRENGIPLFQVFRDPPAEVKGATRKGVEEFLRIVDSLTAMVESQPPSLVLQSLLDHTAFFGYRESGNDEDETRLENMNQLMESMEEYEEEHADGNLHDFLDEISLLSAEELAEGEEGVTLMTIHSAKGLEFDVVFLPGWEDGVFPMKRRDEEVNMEEERRLAYVSITRARKKVFISRARERGLYGPAFKMDASPFLHELPRDCLQFEGGDVPRERLTEISGDLFASIKGGNYHQSAPSSAPRAVSQTPRRPSPARESAAAPAASTSGLTAGVTVSHPKFGVGVIKAVVGEGKMEKAIVSFRNGETKVIVTSFLTPN